MSDIFLKQLSYLINENNLAIPMTFHINGSIVCGTTLSYNEYINLLLSPDKNTFFDQVIQSCHNLNMDTNHDTLYDFIHLSKVHVIHDEINPYSYDEPIRIKLSDISAYQFGGYDFLKNRK